MFFNIIIFVKFGDVYVIELLNVDKYFTVLQFIISTEAILLIPYESCTCNWIILYRNFNQSQAKLVS